MCVHGAESFQGLNFLRLCNLHAHRSRGAVQVLQVCTQAVALRVLAERGERVSAFPRAALTMEQQQPCAMLHIECLPDTHAHGLYLVQSVILIRVVGCCRAY